MKHVKRLREINKLRNIASSWLYSENLHRPIVNVHKSLVVEFLSLLCPN